MDSITSMTPEQWEMSIYEGAIEKWGATNQIIKAMEELGELQRALARHVLGVLRPDLFTPEDAEENEVNLSKERADVMVMLNQMDVILGDNSDMELAVLEDLERRVFGYGKASDRDQLLRDAGFEL